MPRPKRKVPIDRYVVRTLAEVAVLMRVSPMRIYQIEQSALAKLRKAFEAEGFRGHYDSN